MRYTLTPKEIQHYEDIERQHRQSGKFRIEYPIFEELWDELVNTLDIYFIANPDKRFKNIQRNIGEDLLSDQPIVSRSQQDVYYKRRLNDHELLKSRKTYDKEKGSFLYKYESNLPQQKKRQRNWLKHHSNQVRIGLAISHIIEILLLY